MPPLSSAPARCILIVFTDRLSPPLRMAYWPSPIAHIREENGSRNITGTIKSRSDRRGIESRRGETLAEEAAPPPSSRLVPLLVAPTGHPHDGLDSDTIITCSVSCACCMCCMCCVCCMYYIYRIVIKLSGRKKIRNLSFSYNTECWKQRFFL